MKIEEKFKNKYLYKNNLNFFKIFYFFYQYIKSIKNLKKSYSNWGVDMMANDVFKNKKKGFFIDIGCHHPFLNNNTYSLYKRGWTGINIDLDFNSIDMFNFFRKKDLNIVAAVSDKIENKDLYFFHNRSAVNTLSKNAGTKAKEIKSIKTNTINNIIENSAYKKKEIDFISIDVEGHELNVLKGIDFKRYNPKLVVIEFINYNNKEFYEQQIQDILNSELNLYMEKQEYKLVNWIHDDLVYIPNK